MNEIEKLRAAYAALQAMLSSTDADIKASATALVEKMKAQASTLGIDLDAAATDPAAVVDPAVAGGAAAPGAAPPPPAPAVAAADTAKPTATAVASRTATVTPGERPATMTEIRRMMAEDTERKAMTEDKRLSPGMRNVVASADRKTAPDPPNAPRAHNRKRPWHRPRRPGNWSAQSARRPPR